MIPYLVVIVNRITHNNLFLALCTNKVYYFGALYAVMRARMRNMGIDTGTKK